MCEPLPRSVVASLASSWTLFSCRSFARGADSAKEENAREFPPGTSSFPLSRRSERLVEFVFFALVPLVGLERLHLKPRADRRSRLWLSPQGSSPAVVPPCAFTLSSDVSLPARSRASSRKNARPRHHARAGRVALPVSLPQKNCRGSGRALGSAARRNRGHFLKKPVVQIGQLIKTKLGMCS